MHAYAIVESFYSIAANGKAFKSKEKSFHNIHLLIQKREREH